MMRRTAMLAVLGRVVLGRVALGLVFALWAAMPGRARAQTEGVFQIDQRFASIQFSVDHLGLFTSHGDFQRFMGSLAIDPAKPELTTISVKIDAQSVDVDSPQGLSMVRSPDYFDVAEHPTIIFRSTGVAVTSPDHYRINGTIEIRGVTKPMTLDAVLAGRERTPAGPVSEFDVDGTINRAEFGMVADQNFVSETVQVHIRARIALDHPAPAASGPNAG
jgi:polyisoprenoid-binding protein YceI